MGAHYEALCRYLVFSGLYAVLACALHTPQTLHHQASSQVQLRRVHVICSGPSLMLAHGMQPHLLCGLLCYLKFPLENATARGAHFLVAGAVGSMECDLSVCTPSSVKTCSGMECALSVCTPSPVKTCPGFWCAQGKQMAGK